MLLLLAMFVPRAAAEGLYFKMLDVGMAECMIITVDGETMVVDTAYVKNGDAILKALNNMHVDSIKYLVLSHPHADHIGGTRRIIENFQVHTAILPPIEYDTDIFDRTIQALHQNGTELIYPYPGDTFQLGEATIIVYGPHPVAYEDENNWSIVLMVEYAGRRILLTGDAEAEAEYDMLAYSDWFPLKADVLKVGHHGSNTSSTYEFVKAVSPEYAIISCGEGNIDYPHVETALTLVDCGVSNLLTTKMQGDISIRIYENGFYTVSGERSETFSLRK